MKSVRAKFRVNEANHRDTGPQTDEIFVQIKMSPVYDNGNAENASFSKHTPQGEIELCITNPDAVEKFELGKSYYVDFTPAD